MSTKSTILLADGIDIYSEGAEARHLFGKFIGWDIYLIIENTHIISISVDEDMEYLLISHRSKALFNHLKIWLGAIVKFDYDIDGLLIVIRGGSPIEKSISRKDFSVIEDRIKLTSPKPKT